MRSIHQPTKPRPAGTIAIAAMMAISLLILLPGSASATSHCDETVSSGQSIQDALDAASAGDTICVGPGTYPGALEIDTADLTLQSTDGPANTIIDPEGGVVGVRIMSGGLGDVTVDGFTVLGDWVFSGIGQGLAAADGTAFHVVNNVVMAPPETTQHGNAIQITGDGSTVLNNMVTGPHQVSADWTGSGILLFGASNVLIQGNTVTSAPEDACIILGGDDFGAPAAHNNSVVDNLVQDCGSGIVIEPGVHNTVIAGNKLSNGTIGMQLLAGVEDGIELHFNSFSGNGIGLENAEGNPTADATLNWWGCSDGPDNVACDSVVGAVTYDPWLTEPGYTGSTEFEQDEDVIVEATFLDSNGDGVAGLEVEFFLDHGSVGTDMTNEAGVASLNLGPQEAGVYDVRALAIQGDLMAEATVTVQGEAIPPPDPEPECPIDSLGAIANEDGSITVSGSASGAFDLYRKAGGGEAQLVGTFDGEFEYHDTDTDSGTTYTYYAVSGPAECAQVEVTAIPVFPTIVAAVAAVGLSGLGYVMLRRRK